VSKLNYLAVIFFLLVIGFIMASQLKLATRSASQLIAAELLEKIEIHITKVYQGLKRFPNSADEFDTLVLHRLDLTHYPQPILIRGFQPGSSTAPAVFQVFIKEKTTSASVILSLVYYGSEYEYNPLYKGKLFKR
jgi:hypothetical protein